MKTIKRLLASLMVVVMVLTAAPLSGFVGFELPDFSGLFSTKAEAATDPYYSKYGVTYNQLFKLYPRYLSPTGESVVLEPTVSAYTDVIESYDSYSTFVGSYLYNLKEGVSVLSTTILSSFGLTKTYEEKFRSNSIQALMREVQSYSSVLDAVKEQIEDDFGKLKDSYNLTTAAGKLVLISDLKERCLMLTDATVEDIANGIFENQDEFMGKLGNVADLASVTISIVCLFELETTLITELMNSLDSGSVLKQDMGLLLNDLNKNPIEYVVDHYLNDYMADLYAKAISSAIANAANSGTTCGATIAGALVSTVFKLAADHLYIWALGDEIAQTIFLSTYTTDLDIAVTKRKTAFLKGTAKTDDDISEYKLLYSAYVRSIKVTLESALIMAKTTADKNRVKEAISLINTFTYDKYIEFCMTQLKRDIDAGKVKKPSSMNEGDESSTATQEESRISIQEKFRQLQAAYPPNQGVTFFQSYGGAIQCFGFARFAFNKIFDCDMPASYKNEKRYEYLNNQNVVMLGQLNGAGAVTEANVKELLSQALVGDIIQACGASQHTMMVVGVSDSGVTVYECNWGGDCCIYQRTISFAAFAAAYSQPHSVSASGVTLYRAANYDSLYWDGTAVFYDDSVNFVIENGVLTKYNGWQQYVLIPEEVTAIGDRAFYNNDRIIGVTMMDGVVSIGQEAFKDCDNLYFCQLSNALESIGSSAFYSCDSLSSAHFPDTLTSLGDSTHYHCISLSSVILSKNLISMGTHAFQKTSISEIEIPKSLKECGYGGAGDYSFDGTKIFVYGGPFTFCDNLKTVTFENGITTIPSGIFAGCTGLEEITIPDTVTEIGSNAFNYCLRLKKVNIGSSVTMIDEWAFSKCFSLTTVNLPESLTKLGVGAFRETAIDSVEIPKSLKECGYGGAGDYSFDGTKIFVYGGPFTFCDNLKTVTFENRITTIPSGIFAGCTGLEEITIPDTVTEIGSNAFNYCLRLKKVNIGSSVTMIDEWAFSKCFSLTTVNLPESLTKLGVGAFRETAIDSVEIPKSLKECGYGGAGDYSFDGTKIFVYGGPFTFCDQLKTVTFENGVTTIPTGTFAGCTGLEEVTIPDTVSEIGSEAFSYCLRLKDLTITDSVKAIGNGAFSDCVSLEKFVLPRQTSEISPSLMQNCISLKEVVLHNDLERLGYYCFADCFSLTNIELPDSVVEIENNAFTNCMSLQTTKLSESVTSIYNDTFNGCTALKTIKIPDAIESIGAEAFSGCTSLESFEYSENTKLKTISKSAFYGCTSLKEAILPETVTSVGSYAFQNCTALEKVYIPQSTKTIGSQAFRGCELLSDVTFADYSISEIPSQAFMDCPSLTEIVFPKGLKKIGSQAFVNDTSLFNLTIPMSVTSIDSTAFSYPVKTTIFGVAGTYVETFADNGGFNFTDISAPCEGIILVDEVENVILDVGETFRAVFEYWPEEHTDIVTLTESNNKVTINGMDIYARNTGDTVITATTSSGCTYEFNVHIRSPKSISITTQPNKLEYITGEELDLTGMVVQVLYNDNSTKEVSNYTVSGFDSSAEGTYTVTVKWVSATNLTYSTKFTVTVIDPAPELTGIEVTRLPDKTTYAKRESFDPTGMVVSGLYSGGSIAEVTGYKVTGYNALKTGTQTITVTFEGFTAQFTVTVGASCTHSTTEIRNALDATCMSTGYTGDTYCTSCNVLVSSGAEIPAVLQGCLVSGDKLYGLTSGMSTDEFIAEYFNSDTSAIEFDSSLLATGVIVTVTHQNGASESFEILIFGDVNGDSWYDGQDAVLVSCLANGMLTQEDVIEAVYMAADCNHDGVIDSFDVALLEQAGVLLASVDQSKSSDELATDEAYIEYLDLIDQSPEIEVEDESEKIPESDTEQNEAEINVIDLIINFIMSIFETLIVLIHICLK